MTALLYLLFAFTLAPALCAEAPSELRFSLRADPKTFNPLLVSDESSETVRYLTGGVLLRLNRQSSKLQPELAVRWKVLDAGRRIDFELRPKVSFSDGSAFTCDDVAYTMREMMHPATHSPFADSFRSGSGTVVTQCPTPHTASIRFPEALAGLDALFDQVVLISSKSGRKDAPVLGPYAVAEHKAGVHVLLKRNPYYWKRNAAGRPLPLIAAIRLSVQQNRETEMLRFEKGQVDLIDKLDPELYDRLREDHPAQAVDAGPSLDWEVVFFNQAASAPIPEHKKVWFRSTAFRLAISEAVNRSDMIRVIYRGHAVASAGPVSPANTFWVNAGLKPHPYSTQSALKRLRQDGFRLEGNSLFDKSGNPVEFSLITNAGNKAHERMLAMIQQDLTKIGIRLNVTALDFASLVDRISKSFRYEACLMAFANISLDPNNQMNVWLSSGANHQWNPEQPTPATAWEAEMDKQMRLQASAPDAKKRKAAFDRVQQIIWDQAPMVFLVHPNALSAVAADLKNLLPAPVRPRLWWNVEQLERR